MYHPKTAHSEVLDFFIHCLRHVLECFKVKNILITFELLLNLRLLFVYGVRFFSNKEVALNLYIKPL